MKCPASNKRFIERGCRPEYTGKACCPTRFICRKFFFLQHNIQFEGSFLLKINVLKNSWREISSRNLPVPRCWLPDRWKNWATQRGRRMQNRLQMCWKWQTVSKSFVFAPWPQLIRETCSRGGATIRCNQIFCDEPMRPQGEGCVLVTPPGACCPSYKCRMRSLSFRKTFAIILFKRNYLL